MEMMNNSVRSIKVGLWQMSIFKLHIGVTQPGNPCHVLIALCLGCRPNMKDYVSGFGHVKNRIFTVNKGLLEAW